MTMSLEGTATVPQWSAEDLGGLWEDIDAVADALDSYAGETYADGGVLCSVLVDGWTPNWDGNSVTIIMDIQLRIERFIL
jgi:hypothetical protein